MGSLTPREKSLALAGVCVVAGVAIGLGIRTDHVEERYHAVTLQQRHVAERAREAVHQTAVRDRWRTRTVVIDRTPDGASHTEIREAEGDRAQASADHSKESSRTETQVAAQEIERERIVTPALPRLSVGALLGLDIGHVRPVVQVDVGYRVLGPLSVTAGLQSPVTGFAPTVLVGARVTLPF
jgi:hypothetical protein